MSWFFKNIYDSIIWNKKNEPKDKAEFETDLLFKDSNNKWEKIINNTKISVDSAINGVKNIPINEEELPNKWVNLTKKEEKKVDLDKKKKEVLSLDILDLSGAIDIFAEMKAVEGFDKEIRDSKQWNMFQKVWWFFMRSFQRMWRDAWIDSKKKKYINEINEWLANWIYSESSIREYILSADKWIAEKAFLSHEEILKDGNVSEDVQKTIDDWLATDIKSIELRKSKIIDLKNALESNYPDITVDLSQLESSLIRLEKAKIQWELETIEAKLNILDIGRIEDWYWQRKEWLVVKVLDKLNYWINKSLLPDWFKKYVWWLVQHPNTAAVVSALATRSVISALVWTAIISWFLAPVAVWAIAWWVLAAGRARREMRDRTAQIDRRWALWEITWNEKSDWESSNSSHKTNDYQHSAMDLYNKIAILNTPNENEDEYNKLQKEALISWIYYLVKHRVGREKSLNMLQYDSNKSVSSQHVEMIMLMNKFFPWLVNKFNSWELFDESNNSEEALLTRKLYNQIDNLANDSIDKREQDETKYATKQWLIYWAFAAWVWASVAWILSLSWWHYEMIQNTKSDYADNLVEHTHVKRNFWFDNKTVKIDHTELMIHTNKSGWWNVSNMIWKTPFTNSHSINHVSWADFTSNKLQAVITPKVWWPSFVLPIDSHWNIQIPQSMKSAFNSRSFAFLEVWKVDIETNWTINLQSIATVKWNWTMLFEKHIWETVKHFVPNFNYWYPFPVWWNKYHELWETNKKAPVWEFIKIEKPKKEKSSIDLNKSDDIEEFNSLMEEGDFDNRWDLTKLNDELSTISNEVQSVKNDFEWRYLWVEPIHDLNDDELDIALWWLEMEYNSKKTQFYTKVKEAQKEKLDENKEFEYENNINELMNSWMLASINDKPLMYNWNGRTFISVKTSNGWIIPFYRSSNWTSGKNAWTWYPSFGITDDSSWLIKWSLSWLENWHWKRELKNIQNKLNWLLNWPANWDSDFNYHKDRNPLSRMWAINSHEWIDNEELNQKSKKPEKHNDWLAKDWVNEWVNRVTESKFIF